MGHIIICTRCFVESSFRMLLTCKTGGECPWSPNTISSVDDFRTELTELTKLALYMKYVKTNYFFIQNKFQLQDELRRPFLYLFHVYNSPSRRLCRFDVAIPSVYFSSTIIKFTKLCIFAHFGPRLKCNSRLYISGLTCNL